MFKSMSAVGISFFISACGGNVVKDVKLSSDRCWEKLNAGATAKGSAILFYFPGDNAFLSNSKCPENTIGVSLKEEAVSNLDKYFKQELSRSANVIGMSVEVDVVGSIFYNPPDSRPMINAVVVKPRINGDITPISLKNDKQQSSHLR